MTCTVHTIRGPNQSGKTTLALGALEALHQLGIPVVYVLPTYDWARQAARRTKVPCLPWGAAVASPDPSWRAVAVEDLERVPKAQIDAGIEALRNSLAAHSGPTQLLLIETTQIPSAWPDRRPTAIAAGWRLRAASLASAGMSVAPACLRECADELEAAVQARAPTRSSWYAHESADHDAGELRSECERLRGLLREAAVKFDAYAGEGFRCPPLNLMRRINEALNASLSGGTPKA